MTLALLLAAAYGLGVVRVRAWPAGRTGAAATAALLLAGAQRLPDGDFRVHAAQHVLLAALVPLLVARSAPVTLALRTLRGAPRRRLLAVLHSRAVRVVASWPVVLALPTGSAYALYLTPLYGLTERSALAHGLVHLHMLLAGLLAAQVLAGLDPLPGRPRVRTRLLVLAGGAGAHDVLATWMYAHLLPAGVPAGQLHAGALLLYYGTGAVELATAGALLADWYARTGRELARERRRAGSGRVAA